MLKDDSMISVLSVVVLMVAVGTVIQQSSAIYDLLGLEDPDAAANKPALTNDFVTVRANDLAAIDIFANDRGLTPEQRVRLTVNSHPACGRLFVQGAVLQYLPENRCKGKQTFVYSVPGVDGVATVTATVLGREGAPSNATPTQGGTPVAQSGGQAGGQEGAPAPKKEPTIAELLEAQRVLDRAARQETPAAPAPAPLPGAPAPSGGEQVAATPSAPSVPASAPSTSGAASDRSPGTTGTAGQGGTPVERTTSASTGTPSEIAAIQAYATRLRENARPPTVTTTEPPQQPVAGAGEEQLAAVNRQSDSGVARTASPGLPAPAGAGQAAAGSNPAAGITSAAPGQPTDLGSGGTGSDVAVGTQSDAAVTDRVALAPPQPASGNEQQLLVAVVELQEPTREPPSALAEPTINVGATLASQEVDPEVRFAALDALNALDGRATARSLGVPLSADPVDPSQGPYEPPAETTETPAATAGTSDAPRPKERPATAGAGDGDRVAALRPQSDKCQTPPGLSIDLRRAAQTSIAVSSPCHAGSVAELSYSGLRFAIPIDGRGNGSLTAPGFEANAPAVIRFNDGVTTEFDLPFKGMNRIVRVAVIWDQPIALELNALEFGAPVGSPGHVRPDNPRSFAEVRRDGGGFLTSYRAAGGIGLNADVYSLWVRRGGDAGVVKMFLDFASRNRDKLPEACGKGRYAAPEYIVLRSLGGRLERPVSRRLAAISCSEVAQETGDNRLIPGAIADLVVRQ